MSKASKRARWQSYVDDALLKTGQVTEAAIHGLDGKRWASSPGLEVSMRRQPFCTCYTTLHSQITPAQIVHVVANITGEESSMRRSGLKVSHRGLHSEKKLRVYVFCQCGWFVSLSWERRNISTCGARRAARCSAGRAPTLECVWW